jgi:hypothetical protein
MNGNLSYPPSAVKLKIVEKITILLIHYTKQHGFQISHEFDQTKIKQVDYPLISINKCSLVARIVREFRAYQQTPYNFPSNEKLVSILLNPHIPDLNDKVYMEMSLQREPENSSRASIL